MLLVPAMQINRLILLLHHFGAASFLLVLSSRYLQPGLIFINCRLIRGFCLIIKKKETVEGILIEEARFDSFRFGWNVGIAQCRLPLPTERRGESGVS